MGSWKMRGEEGEATGVNGGGVRVLVFGVCMCEPKSEQRGRRRRQRQRETNKLCVRGVCRHSLYTVKHGTMAAQVLVQTTTRKCTSIMSC